MIAIIDYGRGNLFSIAQAFNHLGIESEITDDPVAIATAERIVLPGVGAFGAAMKDLRDKALVSPLREAAAVGKPFLGICLGMQLLCDASEEFGRHEGLGLIAGCARRLPESEDRDAPGAVRIPNVGWRRLKTTGNDAHFEGVPDEVMVYFNHSFGVELVNPAHLSATIRINGIEAAATIRRERVVGHQFHPEKSGPVGLDFLKRFLELSAGN